MTERPEHTAGGTWTPKTLLDWTEGYFESKGIETPRLDAELLLAHVLGCPRINLYLQFDRPMDETELATYRALVRQRGQRQPLAHLTRAVGFWSLELEVAEGCYLPSKDTETLVEATVAAAGAVRAELGGPESPLLAVELGTGSGAIPLAVCSELQHLTWVGVEVLPAAVAVAAANRRRHEALLAPRHNAYHVVRGDRLEAIRRDCRPHLIVSNPPYIPTGTIERLMPEVSRFQPRAALDGGRSGFDFHRYLLDFAAEALVPGGRLLLEMGADQERELRAMGRDTPGLAVEELRRDLSGHPRVLHLKRKA